jgi:hypothetical protein
MICLYRNCIRKSLSQKEKEDRLTSGVKKTKSIVFYTNPVKTVFKKREKNTTPW